MNGTDMFNAMAKIDESLIDGSIPAESDRKNVKKQKLVRLIPVVAVLVLAVTAGVIAGGFAIAAEAKEYKEAVSFFEDHGLSMEGLNRAEVKAVYRDITTNSFTYGKTAEVLRNSVPGFELLQDEPTAEELAAVWNYNSWGFNPLKKGYSYEKSPVYVSNGNGYSTFEKTVVKCYKDGEVIWEREFPGTYISDGVHTESGTFLWGNDETVTHADPTSYFKYSWVARFDDSGKIVFTHTFDRELNYEYVLNVYDNGDGTYTVISRGRYISADDAYERLYITQLDATGTEIRSVQKSFERNSTVVKAVRYNQGYILLMKVLDNSQSLHFVDGEGNEIRSFSYEEDDFYYSIMDATECGGRIFVSAYAYKKADDFYGRWEIGSIMRYIYGDPENPKMDITSEELTPVVRANYTAVLLILEPESGSVEKFFSVKGCLGAALNVGGSGDLEWDVENITSTRFSPATSSFSIAGVAKVIRYEFDENGSMIGFADTGETATYRR